MTEFLLNKILLILFIMSLFNCLKHIWNIIDGLREVVPQKYEISSTDRFLLGLSISYIITTLFTGLQI